MEIVVHGDPKFKVADHCVKGYIPNWSEQVFLIKKS